MYLVGRPFRTIDVAASSSSVVAFRTLSPDANATPICPESPVLCIPATLNP